MKLKLEELRRASNIIFDHLSELGVVEVELKQDFYWNIPEERLYDVYRTLDPTDFNMGQLSDDWNEIQAIQKGDKEPIGYSFVWLSSLLRAVGEKHVL